MRRLDFVEVVHQAVNLVANQLKLSGIDLRAELPARSIVVSGNEDLLQQVVTNLLLNAANAMDDRGGKVTLEIEAKAGFVVLTVTDNGRGIAEGDLRNVFDPFFTTMPVGKGTGLGLSICYAIVDQHDGKIDVTSTAGQGTTITVSLPEGAPFVTTRVKPTRRPRSEILVVDDDDDMCWALQQFIQMEGHRATAVTNARAAVDGPGRTTL